jgi:DNA-binding NarL/FixJ family response regulator
VVAAPDTSTKWLRRGEDVRDEMNVRPADLAILDSQIGAMGGVAVALDLRLEADAGRLEARPVLLVLDRRPDVFMARRSGAEGWILKPLDPIRLRKAVAAVLAGGTWHDTSFLPDPVAVPVE